MALEIETKLALHDPAGLRARLAALGAGAEGGVFEINSIFDTPDGGLRAAAMALRLREIWSADRGVLLRATLTLKRRAGRKERSAKSEEREQRPEPSERETPARGQSRPQAHAQAHAPAQAQAQARGAVKVREEVETGVADGAAAASILASLGYQPVIVYEKRRETFRRDECEIVIDELPVLGFFTEIEGPSESAVEAAIAALLLDTAPRIEDTYIALAARAGIAVDRRIELRFR